MRHGFMNKSLTIASTRTGFSADAEKPTGYAGRYAEGE